MAAISLVKDTPDFSSETAGAIRDAAILIYKTFECDGFACVDLFLADGGEIYFNEINTIPWIPEHGRFAKMLMRAGYSIQDIVREIVEAR